MTEPGDQKKSVEKFIQKLKTKEINWLKSKVLQNKGLIQEEEEIFEVFLPIIAKFFAEIRDKLEDQNFSKDELSEMYFQEMQIQSIISNNLKEKLSRELNINERQLISELIAYYEQLLVDVWFEF